MRRFLKKIASFLLWLLLVATVLQWGIDRRISNKTVNGYDNLHMTVGPYDMVFLGSSRCFVQLDPTLFRQGLHLKAVNLGTNGHPDILMYILRLNNYLARNKAPEYALLECRSFYLCRTLMEGNEDVGHKNSFARYAWFPSAVDQPLMQYFGFNLAERYIPLYALLRYKLVPDCITLSNVNNWAVYGYFRHDDQWDTLKHPVSISVAGLRFRDTGAAATAGVKQQLALLDSICIRNKIRLICIQTPVYRAGYIKSYFSQTRGVCSDLEYSFFSILAGGS